MKSSWQIVTSLSFFWLLVNSQFGSQVPYFTRPCCKSYIFINSNLFYKNWKQNFNNTALILLLWYYTIAKQKTKKPQENQGVCGTKVFFLALHIFVYLHVKFQVCSLTLGILGDRSFNILYYQCILPREMNGKLLVFNCIDICLKLCLNVQDEPWVWFL